MTGTGWRLCSSGAWLGLIPSLHSTALLNYETVESTNALSASKPRAKNSANGLPFPDSTPTRVR